MRTLRRKYRRCNPVANITHFSDKRFSWMKNHRNFAPEKQNEKAKLWHTIIITTMNMNMNTNMSTNMSTSTNTSMTATAHANTIIMDMSTTMNMSMNTIMDMSIIITMRRAA